MADDLPDDLVAGLWRELTENRRERSELRAWLARHEAEHRAEMRAMLQENRAFFARLGAAMDANTAAVNDMRDQIRAQTEALWQLVDRMDRLDPGGAAA